MIKHMDKEMLHVKIEMVKIKVAISLPFAILLFVKTKSGEFFGGGNISFPWVLVML